MTHQGVSLTITQVRGGVASLPSRYEYASYSTRLAIKAYQTDTQTLSQTTPHPRQSSVL